MATNHYDVLVAVATAIGVIGAAYYARGKIITTKKDLKKAKEEIEQHKHDNEQIRQHFAKLLVITGRTIFEIDNLVKETEIDRFLMLTAINGMKKIKKTTAYFQRREEGQKEYKYEDVKIDDNYRSLLKITIEVGYTYFLVSDLPHDALIKRIYEMEGVKASMWILIDINYNDDGTVAVTYASLSTHKDGGICEETKTRILVSRDMIAATAKMLS